MQEKHMVADIISGTKSSIKDYASVITECCDPTLRNTFQQMRNGDEKFHFELCRIAEQKGYYNPAPTAPQTDVTNLKTTLQSSANMS